MKKFIKKIKINEKTINFLLILILGFLVGVAVKTEAKKQVTIGYGDYLASGMKQGFDLNSQTPVPTPNQDGAQPDNGTQPAPDNTAPSNGQ